MKYCKLCLTTDLRPNSDIGEDSVCIACRYSISMSNSKHTLELKKLINLIGNENKAIKKHAKYDCIVGVSGGKDSTRQAHWVRDRLGMTPLLICCGYPPIQMTDVGAENLSNLVKLGFDLEIFTPSPKAAARLSLASFEIFGNVCKSTEMALFATVPRIAIMKKINIIFWGENPSIQEGDSATLGKNNFDANNLRKSNTLSSGGYQWIEKEVGSIKTKPYLYPSEIEFDKANLNMYYLGPAWDDWSMDTNSAYAALNGLTLRPNEAHITGDVSGASMLDEEFTNINMMIKYFKFGFGRATDICNERIRAKTTTRKDAIQTVEKFDGVCSEEIIKKYCLYVGIGLEYFWETVDKFVNKEIFYKERIGVYKKKFDIGTDYYD